MAAKEVPSVPATGADHHPARPPIVLLVGRPQRSKRTFLNWCVKDSLWPPSTPSASSSSAASSSTSSPLLRPSFLSSGARHADLEALLDDVVLEVSTETLRSVPISACLDRMSTTLLPGVAPEQALRAAFAGGGGGEAAGGGAMAGTSSNIKISGATSSSSPPTAAAPAPLVILLPLLTAEEQMTPTLWMRDVQMVKTIGDESGSDHKSKSLLSLDSLLEKMAIAPSVKSEPEQPPCGGDEEATNSVISSTSPEKEKPVGDLHEHKNTTSKREKLKESFSSAYDTTKSLIQIAGVNALMQKSNLLVQSTIVQSVGKNVFNASVSASSKLLASTGLDSTLLGALDSLKPEDLLGNFGSPEEARTAWRSLVRLLAKEAATVLLFVEEEDADLIKNSDILEMLEGAGGNRNGNHDNIKGDTKIFIPKWDLKSASRRETERSVLRSAVFEQHQRATLHPVGFESNPETFMYDDLGSSVKQLVWKGKKCEVGAVGGNRSLGGAAKAKYSYALCRDAVREGLRGRSAAVHLSSATSDAHALPGPRPANGSGPRPANFPNRSRVAALKATLREKKRQEDEKRAEAAARKNAEDGGGDAAGGGSGTTVDGRRPGANTAANTARTARCGRLRCCARCCAFCWTHMRAVGMGVFVLLIALVVRRNLAWIVLAAG